VESKKKDLLSIFQTYELLCVRKKVESILVFVQVCGFFCKNVFRENKYFFLEPNRLLKTRQMPEQEL
jgi:hypothetical protein